MSFEISWTPAPICPEALEIMKRSLESKDAENIRSEVLGRVSEMAGKRSDMGKEFLKLADNYWKDSNPEVREAAMRVYSEDGKIKQAVIDRAREGIHDSDDNVRYGAYSTLPLILEQHPEKAAEVFEIAKAGTTKDGEWTRKGAWRAIDTISGTDNLDLGVSNKIFQMSKAALNESDVDIRRNATDALGYIAYRRRDLAPAAIELLTAKLHDPDALVQKWADSGLSSLQYRYPELFAAGKGSQNNVADERRQSLPVQPSFPKL
jgi:hypothetical protein